MPTEWLRLLTQQRPLWLPAVNETPRVVLSCQASIHRNLQSVPFPPFESHDENAAEVNLILRSELNRVAGWSSGRWLDPQSMPAFQRIFLLEHGCVPVTFCIPSPGSHVLLHPNGHSQCFLNDRNHLSVNSWKKSLRLAAAHRDCQKLIDSLKGRLAFAEDDYYGYLCRDAILCGAGTKLEVFLHLPALALCDNSNEDDSDSNSKINQINAACRNIGVFFNNMSHHKKNATFTLSSGHTAVDAVQEGIEKIVTLAKHIVHCELQERRRLAQYDRTSLLDVVDRAYGLARHARQLEVSEYRRCISALWLGCEEGLFEHLDNESLQDLFGAAGMAAVLIRGKQPDQTVAWSEEECAPIRPKILREKLHLPDRP